MADRTITADLIGRDRSMSAAFDKAGKSASKNGKIIGGVGKAIGTGLKVGAVAAGGGLLALGGFIAQGVKDAGSYQTVLAKTAQVLKTTGNVAGTSVKGIQDQAAALETMSGVDEELIINSQNVLATFTGIRNVGKNKIFDQATKSALDISTALGSDLQGASIQVGKALNDPIKGVGALSKVGVSFTQQQKDQIKTMVKSGDTMGAQKIILGELNKEFGGAAKAAGAGFEGSIARAKDALADAGRTIGQGLLPYVTKLADWFGTKFPPFMALATTSIKAFIGAFQEGDVTSDGVVGKFEQAGVALKKTLDVVIPVVRTTVALIKEWAPVLAPVAAEIVAVVAAMKIWAAVTKAMTAVQGALDVVLAANPIGLVVIAVVALTAVIVIAMHKSEAFRTVMTAVFRGVGNVVLGTISGIIGAYGKVFEVLGHLPGAAGKAFRSAANSAKTAKQAVDNLRGAINRLHGKEVRMLVKTEYRSTFDSELSRDRAMAGRSAIGGRATGGPVSSGTTYMVGENGPELFTAPFRGSIIPRQGVRNGLTAVHQLTKGLHRPKTATRGAVAAVHASATARSSGGSSGGSGGSGGGDTYLTINFNGRPLVDDNEIKRTVIHALNHATAGGAKISKKVIAK